MSDEFFKDLLSDVDAIQAPPAVPSQRQRKAFREAIGLSVLDESKIVTLILMLLRRGSADGREIIAKLNALHVRFEVEGEGAILALLARMDEQQLIFGESHPARPQNDYCLLKYCEMLLQQNFQAVRNVNKYVAALFTT